MKLQGRGLCNSFSAKSEMQHYFSQYDKIYYGRDERNAIMNICFSRNTREIRSTEILIKCRMKHAAVSCIFFQAGYSGDELHSIYTYIERLRIHQKSDIMTMMMMMARRSDTRF